MNTTTLQNKAMDEYFDKGISIHLYPYMGGYEITLRKNGESFRTYFRFDRKEAEGVFKLACNPFKK